jgi:hypothetical protein
MSGQGADQGRLGAARGGQFASPGGAVVDRRRTHRLPACPRAGRWALDGEPPGPSHSDGDVDGDGDGVLATGRRYPLVRVHDEVRERTPETTFGARDAEAYASTSGQPPGVRCRCRRAGGVPTRRADGDGLPADYCWAPSMTRVASATACSSVRPSWRATM